MQIILFFKQARAPLRYARTASAVAALLAAARCGTTPLASITPLRPPPAVFPLARAAGGALRAGAASHWPPPAVVDARAFARRRATLLQDGAAGVTCEVKRSVPVRAFSVYVRAQVDEGLDDVWRAGARRSV